jgi:actin-related protein 6
MKNNWRENLNRRVVVDMGAEKLRFGLASWEENFEPQCILNALARDRKSRSLFIGEQVSHRLEEGQGTTLHVNYPMARGLLHDSDAETAILKQAFSKLKKFDESQSCLCLTTPPLLPDLVAQRYLEVVFEDLGFDAFFKASAPSMARVYALDNYKQSISPLCQLVIDSGFSFTYAIPYFQGIPLTHAATRIDVGGKLLTNLLNEIISYRDYNLSNETYLVNQMKEQLCEVSLDFKKDLIECK